jgi:hypothetical protein
MVVVVAVVVFARCPVEHPTHTTGYNPTLSNQSYIRGGPPDTVTLRKRLRIGRGTGGSGLGNSFRSFNT